MPTLEKMGKDRDGKHGSGAGNADLPHGRKGHTEEMHEKMDYSERGSRSHGKTHKDCY